LREIYKCGCSLIENLNKFPVAGKYVRGVIVFFTGKQAGNTYQIKQLIFSHTLPDKLNNTNVALRLTAMVQGFQKHSLRSYFFAVKKIRHVKVADL
jgi:hypothetical protein